MTDTFLNSDMATTTESREVIGIESGGQTVSCTVGGRQIIEMSIQGDGVATYVIDAREERGAEWIQDVGPTYSGSQDHLDTLETGWEQIRVRCTSGTGTAGDEATVVLCAGGA